MNPLVVAGTSRPGPCGVRDAGVLLDTELGALGYDVRRVWVEAPANAGWREGLRSDVALLRQVRTASEGGVPTLWHYSPFTLGAHGIPMLAVLLPLIARGRVVVFLHETWYAGRAGWRGAVWRVVQRAAVRVVAASADAVVVTTPERARLFARQLPTTIPIWSTVPAVAPRSAAGHELARVGIFGWGGTTTRRRRLLLDALTMLRRPVVLVLVGARPDTVAATEWLAEAKERGVALERTSVLDPTELSHVIAELDVYVTVDEEGPSARRTTLAAALAHGIPVVATDGPHTWPAFRQAHAMRMAAPRARELADVVRELLDDQIDRAHQGDRGRRFYEEHQSVGAAARAISVVIHGPAG